MIQSTRKRLVQTAHELFCREGFHGVGLDRIPSEVGVTETTFYNHFESKDQLDVEVLRERDRWRRVTFGAKVRERGGDDPCSQLEVVFEVLSSDEYHGCRQCRVLFLPAVRRTAYREGTPGHGMKGRSHVQPAGTRSRSRPHDLRGESGDSSFSQQFRTVGQIVE